MLTIKSILENRMRRLIQPSKRRLTRSIVCLLMTFRTLIYLLSRVTRKWSCLTSLQICSTRLRGPTATNYTARKHILRRLEIRWWMMSDFHHSSILKCLIIQLTNWETHYLNFILKILWNRAPLTKSVLRLPPVSEINSFRPFQIQDHLLRSQWINAWRKGYSRDMGHLVAINNKEITLTERPLHESKLKDTVQMSERQKYCINSPWLLTTMILRPRTIIRRDITRLVMERLSFSIRQLRMKYRIVWLLFHRATNIMKRETHMSVNSSMVYKALCVYQMWSWQKWKVIKKSCLNNSQKKRKLTCRPFSRVRTWAIAKVSRRDLIQLSSTESSSRSPSKSSYLKRESNKFSSIRKPMTTKSLMRKGIVCKKDSISWVLKMITICSHSRKHNKSEFWVSKMTSLRVQQERPEE